MASNYSKPAPSVPGVAFHYGGSLAKGGSIGANPRLGRQFKFLRHVETIVRLEEAGFPEAAAATMLVISVSRLRWYKRQPEYLEARLKITHGIILDQAGSLAQIKSQRKEMLTALLPAAFQVLANELQTKATTLHERKHQVDVARDLMDREGTFAKISRAEIKPVDSFDFERADEVSRSVIQAIKGFGPQENAHTLAAIEANGKFSNSHTLSQTDQQKALEALEAAAANGEFDAEMLEGLPTDGLVN